MNFSFVSPQALRRCVVRARQIFPSVLGLIAFLGTSPAALAQIPGPGPLADASKSLVRPPVPSVATAGPGVTRSLDRARAMEDSGDFYRGRNGDVIRLWRAGQEVAVITSSAANPERVAQSALALQPVTPVAPGRFAKLHGGEQVLLLQSAVARQAPDARALQLVTGVLSAQPVFLDPTSRLRLVPTGELIVRLKAGVSPADLKADFQARGLELVAAVGSARLNAHLVRPSRAGGDTLALAEQLHGHPQLEWATPNFARELYRDFIPNDPLFPQQQHLHNLGQEGGVPDADVDAVEAWDVSQGNSGIVIAIIDDGVDTTHPDLRIFLNPGESGGGKETNGIDDDGNGRVDDVRGWDFVDDDNNARPFFGSAHGTACAGIAAARLNNGVRAAGIAGNCTILPVKIFDDFGFATTDDAIGAAISYAAEFADVLSNSWGGGAESAFIDAAITDAVTFGRQGKGCPVFFSSGNRGSNWDVGGADLPIGTDAGPGQYSVGFRYVKDGGLSFGEDLVRLDNVLLRAEDGYTTVVSALGPSGRQEFEGSFPPSGWSTSSSSGTAPWTSSTNGAFRGTMGIRSAQSGHIDYDQWTELRTPLLNLTGVEHLAFQIYYSMEGGYDGLVVRIYDSNGAVRYEYPMISFDPFATTGVAYPARHPDVIAVGASTDSDRRADWSQYGAELDIVAPSNGGWNYITTLDAVGTIGYSNSDFNQVFGGTSAAAPLAAGVGALMLSVAPNLTATQVRQTLQATADKIGPLPYPGGLNAEYGAGRVNARRALDEVAPGIVTITSFGVTASESGATGTFTVSRTGPTTSPLTVQLNLGGTATGGTDYQSISSSLTIPAGSRSNNIVVVPLEDLDAEPTETVVIGLVPAAGYTLGFATNATVNLIDNDTQFVSVVASDAVAGETFNTGQFFLSRTGLTNAPLTVTLQVGGTASPGPDYAALRTNLTFFAGWATTNITINPIDDALAEFTETIVVTVVSGSGYEVGTPSSATMEILDNEPAIVTVTAVDNTATEPGLNTGLFRVARTGSTESALGVQLTIGGTAENGVDYARLTNRVQIVAGSVFTNLNVVPLNDPSDEGPESVIVTVAPQAGYTVGTESRAEVALLDDDAVTSSLRGVLALDGTSGYGTTLSSLLPVGSGLGSYTVELWCRPTSLSGLRFLVADDPFDLQFEGSSVNHVLYDSQASIGTARVLALPRINEWNHVAITFDHFAQVMRVALNGQFGPTLDNELHEFYTDLVQEFTVGARRISPKLSPEGLFQGQIDEVRVSDVVRYASDFIPPKRFNSDISTRALYHFDDTAGSHVFVDASGRGNYLFGESTAQVAAEFGPAGATPGPSAHWRFDENFGTSAADASGNVNPGTLQNGPVWDPAGRLGGCLSFDGVDDIVEVPNSADLEVGKNNADFTVATWVNLVENANGTWRALMQKGAGTNRTFSLFLQPTVNRIHYRVSTFVNWNEGGDSIGVLPVGVWTHVALVKSGSKLRLYLNGTLDSEASLSATVIHNSLPLYVGKHPNLPGTKAKLDDLRVYGRALSERELLDLNALVGHWRFAEGTGGVAQDSSPYRNDAVLSAGAQSPSWVPNGPDSALAFDGVDDLVTIPHSATLEIGKTNADFSVAFWLKLQEGGTGAWRALMQKGAGTNRTFSLFLPPVGNRFHFRVSTVTNWNEGSDAITSLPTNTWTHVALVKTGLKLRLYLGGVLDSERTLPTGVVHNDLPLYLGKHPSLPGTKSVLDDLRIYNRALPAGALAELAGGPIPSFGAGPAAGGIGGTSTGPLQLSDSQERKAEQVLASLVNGPTDPVALPVEVLVEGDAFVVRVPLPAGADAAAWTIEGSNDLAAWGRVIEVASRTEVTAAGRSIRELRFPLRESPQFVRLRLEIAR